MNTDDPVQMVLLGLLVSFLVWLASGDAGRARVGNLLGTANTAAGATSVASKRA